MAGIEERADVRMVQAGDGLCFTVKTLAQFRAVGEMRGKNFDRHDAIEARIAGFVHFAHAARANLRDDFVRAKTCTGVDGHRLPPIQNRQSITLSGTYTLANSCSNYHPCWFFLTRQE